MKEDRKGRIKKKGRLKEEKGRITEKKGRKKEKGRIRRRKREGMYDEGKGRIKEEKGRINSGDGHDKGERENNGGEGWIMEKKKGRERVKD